MLSCSKLAVKFIYPFIPQALCCVGVQWGIKIGPFLNRFLKVSVASEGNSIFFWSKMGTLWGDHLVFLDEDFETVA